MTCALVAAGGLVLAASPLWLGLLFDVMLGEPTSYCVRCGRPFMRGLLRRRLCERCR